MEDDESLGFVTKDNLEIEGYDIVHCKDGNEALQVIQNERFDLCLLDVMLPGIDGFHIAEQIRKNDIQTPIIFLTAKSLKEDKIHGLQIGGDDYLTKPFSIEELLLKVEIFLRRRNVLAQETPSLFQVGSYQFDYTNFSLTIQGNSDTLTQREADLLKLFIENPNHLLKRSFILETLWGEDDYFLGRSLDVFISRLRKYLGKDDNLKIENVHGVGFRLKM